ncbi:MAG: hypothetical protein ACTHOD_15355 [Motilibacteraceae bacterium]
MLYDDDGVGLLARRQLREDAPAVVAETCAWTVGLSDRPHYLRRHGRLVASGSTIGDRAISGLPLASEEDGRIELTEAAPGSFQDLLNALTPEGRLYADLLEEQVLTPFTLRTCVRAAQLAREDQPEAWAELLDELGEDGTDLEAVARAAEWDVPLRADVEQLVIGALGSVPLVEVEAEGLPLAVVRAAEDEARGVVASRPAVPAPAEEELAGALFLAEAAVREAGLGDPVPPENAQRLIEVLTGEGLEPDEMLQILPKLPVEGLTAQRVAALLS